MCPCTPDQVSISPPSSANGPGIPGFGIPFSLPIPNINPFPDGFPEDLLDLFNKLKIFMPGGAVPGLSL